MRPQGGISALDRRAAGIRPGSEVSEQVGKEYADSGSAQEYEGSGNVCWADCSRSFFTGPSGRAGSYDSRRYCPLWWIALFLVVDLFVVTLMIPCHLFEHDNERLSLHESER